MELDRLHELHRLQPTRATDLHSHMMESEHYHRNGSGANHRKIIISINVDALEGCRLVI